MSGAVQGRVMVRDNTAPKADAFDVIDAFINDEMIPGWKDATKEQTLEALSRPIEDSFMLAGLAESRSKDAAREAYVNQMSDLIAENERNGRSNDEFEYDGR